MSELARIPLLRHCLTVQPSLAWMPRFCCLSLPDGRTGDRDYITCFKSVYFLLAAFYEHPLSNFNGIHTSLICHNFCLVLDLEMTLEQVNISSSVAGRGTVRPHPWAPLAEALGSAAVFTSNPLDCLICPFPFHLLFLNVSVLITNHFPDFVTSMNAAHL